MQKLHVVVLVFFSTFVSYSVGAIAECPNTCESSPEMECVNPIGGYGIDLGFAYNPSDFSQLPPLGLNDFFDVEQFGGMRVLPDTPRGSLAMALMAEGISPDEVYEVLSTEEGLDRAFSKLSTMEDHIFWGATSQSFQLLEAGEASMIMTYSDRLMGGSEDPDCDPDPSPVGMNAADRFWEYRYDEIDERFQAWRQR